MPRVRLNARSGRDLDKPLIGPDDEEAGHLRLRLLRRYLWLEAVAVLAALVLALLVALALE